MDIAFLGRLTPNTAIWWSNLILYRYNVDTLHMREGVWFEKNNFCLHRFYWNLLFKTKVCWFDYYLSSFFTDSYCGGGGGYLISIAYWLFSFFKQSLQIHFAGSCRDSYVFYARCWGLHGDIKRSRLLIFIWIKRANYFKKLKDIA